jgi:nucleoside-diphosphate-sugar epimerase
MFSRYLILGGAGLVGSTFARHVAKNGAKVVVVDLPSKLSEKSFPQEFTTVEADVLVP